MKETHSVENIFYYLSIPFLVIGFFGNVLVIRIVYTTREMHTPTNYLLVSMAISDITTILVWSLDISYDFGKIFCKLVELIEVSIMVSSITLTVLAVERYHAILKPFRTGLRLNKDNIKKAIAIIWIGSVVICLPEVFLKRWDETYASCVGPWTVHMNHASKAYVIANTVITSLQLVIMIYCYGSLIRGLYFTNTVCPETDGERSSKKKLVITFIVVTLMFFIGNTPTQIFYTMAPKQDDEMIEFYSQLILVADFVFVCTLSLNPIIYAFRSTNFKEGLKRTILCQKSLQNSMVFS